VRGEKQPCLRGIGRTKLKPKKKFQASFGDVNWQKNAAEVKSEKGKKPKGRSKSEEAESKEKQNYDRNYERQCSPTLESPVRTSGWGKKVAEEGLGEKG